MHEPNRVLEWICDRLSDDELLADLPVCLNIAPDEAALPLIIVDLDPSADTLTTTGQRAAVEITAGIRLLLESQSAAAAESYGDALDAALTLHDPETFGDIVMHSAVRTGAFTDRVYESGVWIVRAHTEWLFMCSS